MFCYTNMYIYYIWICIQYFDIRASHPCFAILDLFFLASIVIVLRFTYIYTLVYLFLLLMQLNYTRDASNGVKLDHFGSWLQEHNPKSDADPQHVDAGTLFTRYAATWFYKLFLNTESFANLYVPQQNPF